MVHFKENIIRVATKFGSVVGRKKTEDVDTGDGPKLARVLGLMDLTLLGVGATLGVGVYVLAGATARSDAGPAVTLSFFVAAFASALAGLCYAEFAARVPKAGSAYVYSYVTVGELTAFIIGWNLILEYVIGTASVARAFSAYLDNMMGKVMATTLTEAMPLNIPYLSPYPDFLALGMVLLLTALLAWGVKESTVMNNIFTIVNLATVLIVIVAGLFKVDASNWNLQPQPGNHDPNYKPGTGGFMPFGISGVMAGAAKCFFGFVGFDAVATTGEEAKNPQKHIPLSIVASLFIVFAAYFSISTVVTMMIPYYSQDKDAPLVYAFQVVGMDTIATIVSIGAIFALCTSMLGGLLPAPRLIYCMSMDGTLWNFLSTVNKATKTPLKATLLAGGISGIMAAIFNLEQLIDMMSIGTLLAYTIVALCILLLRYRGTTNIYEPKAIDNEPSWTQRLGYFVNSNKSSVPDKTTTAVSEWAIASFVTFSIITTIFIVNVEDILGNGETWPYYVLGPLFFVLILFMISISLQPQEIPNVFFKVPMLPLIPCVSIFINIYLMMKLDLNTWIRFTVWLVLGGVIYIFYSISHSVEGNKNRLAKQEKIRT